MPDAHYYQKLITAKARKSDSWCVLFNLGDISYAI
jgi:hypothetical protein